MKSRLRRSFVRLLHRTVPAWLVRGLGVTIVVLGVSVPWVGEALGWWWRDSEAPDIAEYAEADEPAPAMVPSLRETPALEGAGADSAAVSIGLPPSPWKVDPEANAPSQDVAKSGYIGDKGTEIRRTMRLTLEALQPGRLDSLPRQLRLGSQEVLPSGTIHVINLWATWCEPCVDEMRGFRDLFARRADWGERVRFVPIIVLDASEPANAYKSLLELMPAAPIMLADRSNDDLLTKMLSEDPKGQLYRMNLPVTLLLDCNRRVRWSQSNQLTQQNFIEIESYVERLRAELADASPDAWCKLPWAGNGRCDRGENMPANHVLEDCGELKQRGEAPVNTTL